jgi:hypothetical protein
MTPAPQTIIAGICQLYGPSLKVPAGLDGAKVLWALAGCESDFGVNGLPKHEDAYCAGHRYDIPALTRKWGCAAHCSYGPWQMMYAHLEDDLPEPLRDPSLLIFAAGSASLPFANAAGFLCRATVAFVNAEILGRQKATTLQQIAKAYNHGNWADGYDDFGYTDRAAKFYAIPFPKEQ